MKNSRYFFPLLLLLLVAACKKNEDAPKDVPPVVSNPEPQGPLGITLSTKLFVGESIAFVSNVPSTTKLQWKFGDGATSEEVNPRHVYSTPGYYTVSVTDQNTTVKKQITITAGCSRMTNTRKWDKVISYTDISGTIILNSSQGKYALPNSGDQYMMLPGDSSSGYFLLKPSLYFESYADGVMVMSNKGDNSSPVLKYYVNKDSLCYTRNYSMISPTKCSYTLVSHTY